MYSIPSIMLSIFFLAFFAGVCYGSASLLVDYLRKKSPKSNLKGRGRRKRGTDIQININTDVLVLIASLAGLFVSLYFYFSFTSGEMGTGYGLFPSPSNGLHTFISGGNVTWIFRDLRDSTVSWVLPIKTYRAFVSLPKEYEYLYLNLNGETLAAVDYRPFITPDFFEDVIADLTGNRTDREFVGEVFNVKRQLVTIYDLRETAAQYPGETLTEGIGSCRDMTVLMASLLEAGNRVQEYGMNISLVYMDIDNPASPQNLSHIALFIGYADNTSEFIESTAEDFPYGAYYNEVVGWYFSIS